MWSNFCADDVCTVVLFGIFVAFESYRKLQMFQNKTVETNSIERNRRRYGSDSNVVTQAIIETSCITSKQNNIFIINN